MDINLSATCVAQNSFINIELSEFMNKTVHGLFESIVEKNPHSTAIIFGDGNITYEQLNQRANQFAYYLKYTCLVKKEDLIVISCDRRDLMLIALLGIIKSGCAYVPIDPDSPDEQVAYILADTKAKIFISTVHYKSKIQSILNHDVEINCSLVLFDDRDFQYRLSCLPKINIESNINHNNLIYVMYTSGTTGMPKGVMVEHINVTSLVMSGITEHATDYRTILLSNTSFDAAVFEMYLPLCNGGTLYIPSDIYTVLSNTTKLKTLLIDYNINILWLTKSLFDTLYLLDNTLFVSLEYLLIGGEALNVLLVNQLVNSIYAPKYVLNGYGPTENTTFSCLHYISLDNDKIIPIGKPLKYRQAYILDDSLRQVSVGVIGELYVGGLGVARGYLNLPELTAQRFITRDWKLSNDLCLNNVRMYKTGDLTQYQTNGDIEYIGRNDQQIKIRGFRIELGEIESLLQVMPEIKQAVVIAKQDLYSNKYLIAYYVSEFRLNEDQLLEELGKSLPSYMLPSALIHINELPLTKNGKLNINELPTYVLTSSVNHVAPSTELELLLCRIYAQVLSLRLDLIGVLDDFFKLGGNSILAIRLVNEINKAFPSLDIRLADILLAKTVDGIAQFITHKCTQNVDGKSNQSKRILISHAVSQYPLSLSQESLWFINESQDIGNAYQVFLSCRLNDDVNMEILQQIFVALLERNEVFRTLIKQDDRHQTYQEILDINQLDFNLTIRICDDNSFLSLLAQDLNRKFVLSVDLPIRAYLYKLNSLNNRNYLVIQIHHVAFDGWSIQLLKDELDKLYSYYNDTNETMPVPKQLQYKHYAYWQKNIQQDNSEQIAYWQHKLSGIEQLNLPTDYPRAKIFDYAGASIYFSVDLESSNGLREVAKNLGVSLFAVLLSGFQLLLHAYSNQDSIVLGIPFANRDDQVKDIIGFFINTLVIKTVINSDLDLSEFLQQVNGDVINSIDNSNVYFEQLVDILSLPRDLSRNPLFQVMFSLQQFNPETWAPSFGSIDSIVTTINRDQKAAIFDILTILDDSQPQITGYINYATSLFSADTINNYVLTYKYILKQISKIENILANKVSAIKYVEENILPYMTELGNYHQRRTTVIDEFMYMVGNYPDKIAVVFNDSEISYSQLNRMTNHIANYLYKNYVITANSIFALYLNRSEFMIASIIAILKIGAGYLPIDINLPKSRVEFILADSVPLAIISDVDDIQWLQVPTITHSLILREDGSYHDINR